MIHYTYLLIPLILFFMGIEYLFALKSKKKGVFKFESSVSNLAVGIWDRFCYLFSSALFYEAFVWVHDNWALLDIPRHWITWILLLLLTDFVWYWYHRMGHEINLFWAAHVVHHQSEEFNLTAAARITILQSFVRTAFWCVLPVVGFNPEMVVSILLIHGGYSFFTHTQLVGKLGWLEKIVITPSHHRVHHGSNPEYLDKNYGDIFVFWDKIFGTFKEETMAPTYGLVKPLDSYSFLWGYFHFSIELWTAMREESSMRKKILLLFAKPESLDPKFIPVVREAFGINPKRQKLTLTGILYVVFQLALMLVGLAWITKIYPVLNPGVVWLLGAVVLFTLVNVSALLEQKRWVYYLEYFRIFLLVLLGVELEYLNFEALVGVSCVLIFCVPLPIKTYYWQTILGIK